MTPWPHAIWLTRSTRTTCRPQVPCVTGVSDSAPNSGAGIMSLPTWQGAWGITQPWQLIKKHETVDLLHTVDKVRLLIVTSVRSAHTQSWCLCLSFNVQMNEQVEKTKKKWEWMHSRLSQQPTYLLNSVIKCRYLTSVTIILHCALQVTGQ